MTASSHHPFGFHPVAPAPAPVPLHHIPAMHPAAPPAPAPMPAQSPEPAFRMCVACGNRRNLTPRGDRYASGAQVLVCTDGCPATPVQAATGVITAAMTNGAGTPREWAQAEHDAGLLFDPQRAQAIEDAAREQERAEMRAELGQAQQDAEAVDWFHARYRAVGALCAGRRSDDCLTVSEVLTAIDGRTTDAPLTITWDGVIAPPAGDRPGEHTLVGAVTARGGSAVLVLDDAQLLDLGERLLSTVHTAEACATPGCGTPDTGLDATNPFIQGWIRVDVAGSESGPRWWCSAACATAAMAHLGAEVAAADQAAATDPAQQAPEPLYGGDVAQWISDAYDSLADMEADADDADAEGGQGVTW